MQGAASVFIDQAASGNPMMPGEVSEIRDQIDLVAFLEALSSELRERWLTYGRADHKRSAQELEWLREARMRTESLNMPVPLILRGLYSAMGTGR